MSQHDQRNGRGTTPIEERMLGRRVSRRTIVRAGTAGAMGLAAAGTLSSVSAVVQRGELLRASSLLQESTPAADAFPQCVHFAIEPVFADRPLHREAAMPNA